MEAPGGGERERDRRRAAKQAHVVIHAIILGVNLGDWGVKNMKQNTFAESGEGALPCDAKGLWKPRNAGAHARRRRQLSDRAAVERQRCSREN